MPVTNATQSPPITINPIASSKNSGVKNQPHNGPSAQVASAALRQLFPELGPPEEFADAEQSLKTLAAVASYRSKGGLTIFDQGCFRRFISEVLTQQYKKINSQQHAADSRDAEISKALSRTADGMRNYELPILIHAEKKHDPNPLKKIIFGSKEKVNTISMLPSDREGNIIDLIKGLPTGGVLFVPVAHETVSQKGTVGHVAGLVVSRKSDDKVRVISINSQQDKIGNVIDDLPVVFTANTLYNFRRYKSYVKRNEETWMRDAPETMLRYIQESARNENIPANRVSAKDFYPDLRHSPQKSHDCGIDASLGALHIMLLETVGNPVEARRMYKEVKSKLLTGLSDYARQNNIPEDIVDYKNLAARIERAERQAADASNPHYGKDDLLERFDFERRILKEKILSAFKRPAKVPSNGLSS